MAGHSTDRPYGKRRRAVVAITGATGAIFGVRILQLLAERDVETHLVISQWGRRTLEHETPFNVADLRAIADQTHLIGDQASPIASGSFRVDDMVIAPCSARTLAATAHGIADNLIVRAADVMLKERRRLVLVVRETPLSQIHLENMLKLSQMGAVIMPPVPAFYNMPESIGDVVDHLAFRVLDQLGLGRAEDGVRWNGTLHRYPVKSARQ